MAKVRQPYDEPVVVPWLGDQTVNPGQVVAIRDDQLAGFLEAGWQPADPAAKKAADKRQRAADAEDANSDSASADETASETVKES